MKVKQPEQWALFRHTDKDGKVICENWAEISSMLSGVESIDRKMEEILGKIFAPKIYCEIVKRQTEKPTN
jgi:hypothetical protein